jgi:hypothetical protein
MDLSRAIYGLFAGRKRIDQTIEKLQKQKAELPQIIDTELQTVLQQKFPGRSYDDLSKEYADEIHKMKEVLREKYARMIELNKRQLELLREDLSLGK